MTARFSAFLPEHVYQIHLLVEKVKLPIKAPHGFRCVEPGTEPACDLIVRASSMQPSHDQTSLSCGVEKPYNRPR